MADKKFFGITVSSCARRRLDLDKVGRCLVANGWEETTECSSADLVLVMMCLSTEANVAQSQKLLVDAAETRAEVIIGGCIPPVLEPVIDALPEVVLRFLPKDGFGPIDQLLNLNPRVSDLRDIEDESGSNNMVLRVQRGCSGNCSYCVARNTIGNTLSKPLEECIREVTNRLTSDTLYITLSGDDVGSYGVDIGTDIGVLVQKLWEVARGSRIRVENLNVKHLVEHEDAFAELARIGALDHIQIPIQHTNPRILQLMNRYSDTEQMCATLHAITSPTVRMETHFIVGFPSETDEELAEAARYCLEQLPFGKVSFFPYMDNRLALSFRMPGKLSNPTVGKRMHWLTEFGAGYGQVQTRVVGTSEELVEVRIEKLAYTKHLTASR